MSTWFLCKVAYLRRLEDGSVKKASEAYLFDAISFTEAEARIYEELSQDIPELSVTNVAKTKYSDVYDDPTATDWYKCKVVYTSVDGDSGKEKKINDLVLVKGNHIKGVCEYLASKISTVQLPGEVTEVVKTPIMAVYPFKAQEERISPNLKPLENNEHLVNELLDEPVEVVNDIDAEDEV